MGSTEWIETKPIMPTGNIGEISAFHVTRVSLPSSSEHNVSILFPQPPMDKVKVVKE